MQYEYIDISNTMAAILSMTMLILAIFGGKLTWITTFLEGISLIGQAEGGLGGFSGKPSPFMNQLHSLKD